MTGKKKDIMLIMSDQHSYEMTGFADCRVETPQLERIAQTGAWFEHCYSNAPLCVPSRASFLTGMMPSELEIFDNDTAIPSDMPTIAHEFGRMGYHTVLAGRMHFKGDDQKHGFDERLCGDITSQYWGTGGKNRRDFGIYAGTTNRLHCLEQVGGGISPVELYDRAVLEETMSFLDRWNRQGEDRPPLFLIAGFYGPHFPFVSDRELYRKYRKRFTEEECAADMALPALSVYQELIQDCDAGLVRDCRAAYCGMVEMLDGFAGQLYDCFMETEAGREAVFIYTSDHGEQLGKRRIFGKQTMYEPSVRVPLLAAGTGIPSGIFDETVSLLDLSRTLLSLADDQSDFSWHRGRVISRLTGGDCRKMAGHEVRIQQMLMAADGPVLAEAAVCWPQKKVSAKGAGYLYQLDQDPLERAPAQHASAAADQWEALEKRQLERMNRHRRLAEWGRSKRPVEWACMKIPSDSLAVPERE